MDLTTCLKKMQLLANGKVQILCYTRFKEMIRLSAAVKPSADE